jgi:hypothetical protein
MLGRRWQPPSPAAAGGDPGVGDVMRYDGEIGAWMGWAVTGLSGECKCECGVVGSRWE